jgi:hypothetical protein
MARINTLQPAVTSMQGRFFRGDKVYFQKKYDACFGVRLENPYSGPSTEEQKQNRLKFTAATNRARAMSVEEPELFAELKRKFKAQRTYKTLLGYCTAYAWNNPVQP